MKILVTGLCSLHWGRMEYGNIGNYYIIVPLFRQLHRAFPGCEIITTLQLTDTFCDAENITTIPMEVYNGWKEHDYELALADYEYAKSNQSQGAINLPSEYLRTVDSCDLIISFAGDMWGDNATGMGPNRFEIDLVRSRTAQLMNKPVVLFASSPGPVTQHETLEFAREVFANFSLVINREKNSKRILSSSGFDVSRTIDAACPAFLFDSDHYPHAVNPQSLRVAEGLDTTDTENVGFILATYSLPGGSFDNWARDDSDFSEYVNLIEHIVGNVGQRVMLISHSNGFILPPDFERTHWRDYKMLCHLYDILNKRGQIDMNLVHRVDNLYQPWEMHALIGQLDLLVSGRVHGAVAGLSQYVPTLAFDYKNGPLAHKMFGFFELAGVEDCVIPRENDDMVTAYDNFLSESYAIQQKIQSTIPQVKQKSISGFDALRQMMYPKTSGGCK